MYDQILSTLFLYEIYLRACIMEVRDDQGMLIRWKMVIGLITALLLVSLEMGLFQLAEIDIW